MAISSALQATPAWKRFGHTSSRKDRTSRIANDRWMRLVKTAGKQFLRFSRADWVTIGTKAGWLKVMSETDYANIISTPEFKTWFGSSKVVGPDGQPLIATHRSEHDVAQLDPKYGMGKMIWFSSTPNDMVMNTYGAIAYQAFLRIAHPATKVDYDRAAEETWGGRSIASNLTNAGFDGYIDGTVFAVVNAEQIWLVQKSKATRAGHSSPPLKTAGFSASRRV
jgi:hypothetical protein